MNNLMDFIYKWAVEIINKILMILPTSPFRGFIDGFVAPQYLGWLNWFFPVSDVLNILTIWLTSISLFYLYSIIMRWTKMIGD